ncbi:MAG: hypothetical protein Q9222_005091 [Ikaeria aurantiellina]
MLTVDLFTADAAHNCLISVPFNATVATQFLTYYKDTLQFQSSLAYLKNPPSTYRQPSIDLLGALDDIQKAVDNGVYENEYDFESNVQKLVYATHDAHVILDAGALSVFRFGAPVSIVSVSTDGIAFPKIFVLDDLLEAYDPANKADWEPSAILSINGVKTIDFLRDFASSNSPGTLEIHADWNQLMSSPANDIQGRLSVFEGSTPFWPGNEITFTFENGTKSLSLPWVATYSVPDGTPPITSGDDFYRVFVLGNSRNVKDNPPAATASFPTTTTSAMPSRFADANVTSTVTATANPTGATALATAAADSTQDQPTSWDYFPYPFDPVTVQPNLGEGGVVTAYFLNDGLTAVLSIPSFDVNNESMVSFSSTIAEFIQKSRDAGKDRFIIDLQRNSGGGNLLATDTFKQFFPSINPFGGSRLRAHEGANALGNTFSSYYSSQISNSTNTGSLIGNPWVASTFINANTGRNFSSWAELYGPQMANGDFFTTTQRDNLSSTLLDAAASGIIGSGSGNHSPTLPQPYDARNIILLSDATCTSACATFIELMHHQASVRTVVAGGLPESGPMQTPSGSRGAEPYSSAALDTDIAFAESVNATSALYLPQNRDIDFHITYASFNLRDAVRQDDPTTTPLQFMNEPADCRIFYTPRTIYNFENLWNYVIDAMWRNPSLCIAGSASPFAPSHASNPSYSSASQKLLEKRSLLPPVQESDRFAFDSEFGSRRYRKLDGEVTAGRGKMDAAPGVGRAPYAFPVRARRVSENARRRGTPSGKAAGRGKGTAGFVDLAFGKGWWV